MNFNPATPSPGPPGNVATPFGWKAEWSAQYGRYFYVNINTNESTWNLPAAPPVQQIQQPIQRKPVPSQTMPSPAQGQALGSTTQTTYVEAYPTPPPQVTTGYFPATSAPQQQQVQYPQAPEVVLNKPQPQTQYPPAPIAVQQQQNPQQQYPQALQQQQPQYPQLQQNYSPAPRQQPQTSPQQHVYTPPSATPNNTCPQYMQQNVQTFSPPPTPNAQPVSNYAPSPQNYPQANTTPPAQFPPQQRAAPSYYPQQQTNFAPPPQQYQQPQYQPQAQPRLQQQYSYPNQPQPQLQPQPQHQTKRTSMMGSNLLNNNMMNKMSTKFTHLQKGPNTGAPSAHNANANANGKPTDWKKWGKRAAIGVAGIGALALGVDAGADMFSSAEGLAGGADFSGADFSGGGDAAGVMDAQTAVDANFAQLSMEQIGQENASMLADPVGTTYIEVGNAASTQGALGLI